MASVPVSAQVLQACKYVQNAVSYIQPSTSTLKHSHTSTQCHLESMRRLVLCRTRGFHRCTGVGLVPV